METVVVLGGLGYIGSHLIHLLDREQYRVRILDIELFGWNHMGRLLSLHNLIYHQTGDIRNAADLAGVIKDADYVIHLAGLVGDPACSLDEDVTWLHNMESSEIIVDICNHYKVKRLIYSSSCSVYGASPSDVTLNEGSYLNPVSVYAKTKIDSEKIMLDKFEGCSTVLRLATAFGWSDRMRFDLVANIFAIKAVKENKIEVFGGKQYRPFIHCYDAALAFLHVMKYPDERKLNGERFNVSCESISILELGKLFGELLPEIEVEITNKQEDGRNYKVDATKIEWLLGFEPHFNLREGILDMINFIRENGYNDWETNNIYYNHILNC